MIKSVSVLMPTYNCATYISQAIQSILWQTYEHFELIVIDDGSTDNTEFIINKFNDNKIRYIKKEHEGLAASLNYGLKIAKYDWIARMDADDLSLPNRLERQINFIENNLSYDIVSSWYVTFRGKKICHLFKLPVDHSKIIQGLELHSTLCHAGTLFTKKLILSVGGYFDEPFEDYDLWLRLRHKANFYNIPEPLILVRLREDSLLRKDLLEKRGTMIHLQNKFLNSQKDFSNADQHLINKEKLKGWREWFYGDKKKARNLWLKNFPLIFKNYRIFFAFLITFLPPNLFELFKRINLKNRLIYLFQTDRKTKKMLNKLLREYE